MSSLIQKLTAPNGRQIDLPTGLFINNEFVAGRDSPLESINPTDETVICAVEAASTEDVHTAVKAARAAFEDPSWRNISPTSRGTLIHRLADLIEADKEILATLETWDNGKPYKVALEEDIEEVLAVLRYFAGWADKIHGQTIADVGPEPYKFAYTIKEPIGVCAQIIPWNYPLGMASWKLGPALACGNTVILKPAEQTPLSILWVASLIPKAGFPPGVINIINGLGSVAGAALASSPDVDKIAFTGSTRTAKQIMQLASSNLKDITLETGGKSPLIVFPDADLEQASKWANVGLMSNQGQICTATSRILVHEDVYDKFLELLGASIQEWNVVGDPFEENTFQGPQVSRSQYNVILGFIQRAKEDGAKLVLGGNPVNKGKGFFVEPTVFAGVTETMELFQEEVFGPVAAITTFADESEAIRLANNSRYGLGAAIFTSDIQKAHRCITKLESGQVWVNSSNDGDARIPFGGVKQSGIGRELGETGLNAYCQTKAVHINISYKLGMAMPAS
ncbi:aldehyde dehydrogenase [Fusarium pseudocircinatum]|uniref:aldehyde dehydrogenase (NAD(+)) n=1 Tax=Fusarium pseudocircinatum TaxID=56676 RepID=A0A8H5PKW1_9HYPO|nr:aldehyde dehydrogenase [Fusarium pseudocircinatum]